MKEATSATSFIDRSFSVSRSLKNVADRLAYLASSFAHVGNSHMFEKLNLEAGYLNELALEVRAIATDKLDSDFKEVNETHGRVLTAALTFMTDANSANQ